MAYKDPFNFFPNEDFKKHPNYRVEYELDKDEKGYYSTSHPAIFRSDKEAIETALREFPKNMELGYDTVIVSKYTRKELKEIFRKVA